MALHVTGEQGELVSLAPHSWWNHSEAERDWLRKRFNILKVDAIEDLALLRRLNLKMSTARAIQEVG